MRTHTHLFFGIALAGLVAGLGAAAIAHGSDDAPPSTAQVAFSQEVSEWVGALLVRVPIKSSDDDHQ